MDEPEYTPLDGALYSLVIYDPLAVGRVINGLRNLVEEVYFAPAGDGTGTEFHMIDCSHVSLVYVYIGPHVIRRKETDRDKRRCEALHMRTNALAKALLQFTHCNSLNLAVGPSKARLSGTSTQTNAVVEVEIDIYDYEGDKLSIPPPTHTHISRITSDTLYRIMLGGFSGTTILSLTIEERRTIFANGNERSPATTHTLRFGGGHTTTTRSGRKRKQPAKLEDEVNKVPNPQSKETILLATRYINNFAHTDFRLRKMFPEVEIRIGGDMPAMFCYHHKDKEIRMEYYLAPKIEYDDF